jgi:hypothetical protein
MRVASMVCALVMVTGAASAPVHAGVADEPLGPIRFGMTSTQVAKAAGAPASKEAAKYAGDATGDWEQTWAYAGATVTLCGDSEKAKKWRVRTINVERGSTWKTKRKIGIGATRAQVTKAYGRLVDKQASTDEEILVSSPDGGNLAFQLTDGKVSSIFVGAAF